MALMTAQEQYDYITDGADAVLPVGELLRQLVSGRPLRVKLGVDPTAPDVTLGWAVVFRQLRKFQECGHIAVLIIGDFTAQVGDPSDATETRRRLSATEIGGYASDAIDTIKELLLPERLEIRHNSEWLGDLDMHDVLDLTSKFTVARIMDRDDFKKRWDANQPISMIEFLYPLLQAMDSVAVEADIEIGGTDQLFNLLVGRDLQDRTGQPGQSVLTVPLLVGTDGDKKMSQSLGNYISVREEPAEMFGKTMSIPDEAMPQWFQLAAGYPGAEVAAIADGLVSGDLHPGDTKRRLARAIVSLYHDDAAAHDAEAAFDRLFRDHAIPDDVPVHKLSADDPVKLPALMHAAGLVASNGEGRRMLAQGAVRVDGEPIDDQEVPRSSLSGTVLQVGRRRFVRLVG